MWRGQHVRRRGRGGMDIYMVMLLAQLIQRVMQLEHKPPVTVAVMAGCFLTFFQAILPHHLRSLIPSVSKACLQPYMIVQNRPWSRLIWAAFLHADEMHLYYNLSSLLWKGVQLEQLYGSAMFAALLVELLLLSHGLFVGLAALAAYYVPEYQYLYISNCAIGISAVLFGLKVVLHHNLPGHSSVFGFTLPTKYMAWAELLLASMFNPQASFLGHLAGIFAGMLHVRVLAPALPAVARAWRRAQLDARIRLRPGQPRFATAGGARPAAAAGARHSAVVASGGVRAGAAAATAAGSAARSVHNAHAPVVQQQPAPQGAAARQAAAAHEHSAEPESVQRGRRLGSVPATAAVAAAAAADDAEIQSSSRAPLSAEELRLRRLQRFA